MEVSACCLWSMTERYCKPVALKGVIDGSKTRLTCASELEALFEAPGGLYLATSEFWPQLAGGCKAPH